MKLRVLLAVATLSLLTVACESPTMPAASPLPTVTATPNVTGSWSGTTVDSQGTTVVTWSIAQTGTQVSGTVQTRAPVPGDGSCNDCHRNKSGTFSGTISGDVLTMTLQFDAGVNGDPTPICSATMTGAASGVAAGQLSGTYVGSDSCEGAFLNGTLAMTRK